MRAAVYLRQSFDPNGDRLAITRQREDCLKVCAAKGWTPIEYVDNDTSASTGKPRPAYQRMLTDIRADKINAVVAWDLDRLHRRPIELEEFIDLADEHRIALATVGGEHDLSTDSGRLYARIKGAFARSEVERKSARQKRANEQRRAMGKWSSAGARTFGYTPQGEPLDPEAPAFTMAAADVLAGASLRGIVMSWNARGITTTRGNDWASLTLRRALMRPVYAGLVVYGGNVVGRGEWPALIDEDAHRGLVGLLTDPSRKAGQAFEKRHMGSGVYICSKCGGKLYAQIATTGGRLLYVCKTFHHLGRSAVPLDELVTNVVLEYLGGTDIATALAETGRKVDVAALRTRRAALEARLTELAGLFAEGVVTGDQLRRGTGDLRAQIEGIDAELAAVARQSPVAALVGVDDLAARWEAMSPDLKSKVVDALLVVTVLPARPGVKVFEPESVRIEWRV